MTTEDTVKFGQEETELFAAVRHNHIDRIKQLVRNGHDVNQICESTCLFIKDDHALKVP